MNDGWYDTAQICANGHVINWMSISKPEYNRGFCDKCGAPTTTNCQYCDAKIMSYYHAGRFTLEEHDKRMREIMDRIPNAVLDYNTALTLPIFCSNCGKPYPWTEAKLKAAKDLSDELDNLSPAERETLKKSIDDIVCETPQTTVAVSRFKRLVAKAGKPAADAFRDILVDILSEAIKKSIWP